MAVTETIKEAILLNDLGVFQKHIDVIMIYCYLLGKEPSKLFKNKAH